MRNLTGYHFFLVEKLHMNEDVDKLSDYIYSELNKNGFNDISIDCENIVPNMGIQSINITIYEKENSLAELDINKSKKLSNGKWVMFLNIKKGIYLDTIKHEIDHCLRLVKKGKIDTINKLNYIKSSTPFTYLKNDDIEYFFHLIYLSSDEEINSMVSETYGLIKEVESSVGKISKKAFILIIKNSRAYSASKNLIDFKEDTVFNSFSNNVKNKFFYLLEKNRKELNKINDNYPNWIKTLRIIWKVVRDEVLKSNKLEDNDSVEYPKTNKNLKYYKKWFNSQGDKLNRKLFSLYDHFDK